MTRNLHPSRTRSPARRLLILLLLAAAAGAWYHWRNQQPAQAGDPGLEFARIETGHIEEAVTAQGKLEPRQYVDVGAQVSGQLRQVHVAIGDIVKQGDLLAEIDPRVYEARVQADKARLKTLQAQLAEQQAQIALARQTHERHRRLIKSNAVSQEALEDAETALKVAQARAGSLRAQLEEAQSQLDGDRTNLGYTRIYAPMDGTVVVQSAREGQTLNATQQAPVIVQIANLDEMTVRAQVAEADVMRLTPGVPVYFTTLGALERRWRGTVRQILPAPEVINDVVLYNALVDVDNGDRELMTGMSTQMFFVLDEADEVPLVPVAALGKRLPHEDNDRGHAYRVRVKAPAGTADRTVHIGLMNRTLAEVRAGLDAGEEVAMAPAETPPDRRPAFMRVPRL